MTEAGGVTLPGEVAGVVALDEVVLHGWDLARATGQEFRCDPASAEAVLGFTERSAQPDQAAMRTGLFGPVVPVAGRRAECSTGPSASPAATPPGRPDLSARRRCRWLSRLSRHAGGRPVRPRHSFMAAPLTCETLKSPCRNRVPMPIRRAGSAGHERMDRE